ncbi:hypothetical protein ABZX51_006673 [Aspergillus tubingensis]
MGIFDTNEAPVYPIRNRAIEYIPDIFEGRISFPLNKSPTQDAGLEDIPSDRDLYKSRSEGELVKGNNFDSGEGTKPFVRLTFSHIARHFPPGESPMRTRFMNKVHETLKPFIADEGYNWEVNGEELEREFVHVNGFRIPPTGSEDEKRWFRDNEPSPWGHYLTE